MRKVRERRCRRRAAGFGAPERVFTWFTEQDKWIAWQGTDAEIELAAGGTWRVNVTGEKFASGQVIEVVENERLVFTWGGSMALPCFPERRPLRSNSFPRAKKP